MYIIKTSKERFINANDLCNTLGWTGTRQEDVEEYYMNLLTRISSIQDTSDGQANFITDFDSGILLR